MAHKEYWDEAFGQLMCELGVYASLSKEQLRDGAETMRHAAEMESEAYGYLSIPDPANPEIAALKVRIKELEAQVEQERSDFVKNICMRRGVEASQVHLEGEGHATVYL